MILLSTFVHVIPHVAMKGASDRTAFAWAMLGVSAAACAAFIGGHIVSTRAWMLILASGGVEALYYQVMSRAYQRGDLGIAYPIARGSAPLFLLLPSIVVLHERLSWGGLAGIVFVASGVFLLGFRSAGRGALVGRDSLGFGAGALTASYTSIDRVGVTIVEPLAYIGAVLVTAFLLYSPMAWWWVGWPAMRETISNHWPRVLVAGLSMPIAYVLVLFAMRSGAPAIYAGALREASVLVAFGAGVFAFGERITVLRICGAVAIVAGVVTIALAH